MEPCEGNTERIAFKIILGECLTYIFCSSLYLQTFSRPNPMKVVTYMANLLEFNYLSQVYLPLMLEAEKKNSLQSL